MMTDTEPPTVPSSQLEHLENTFLQHPEKLYPDVVRLTCRLVTPLLQAEHLSTRRFARSVLRAAEETRVSFPDSTQESTHAAILTPRHLQQAKQYMLENLSGKPSVKEIAAFCRLSASHFSRAFRGSCGNTPHHWLLMQRIEQAKRLLVNSHLSVPEIALECGFSHRVSFSKAFARLTGEGPSAWRRQYQDLKLRRRNQPS